MDQGKKFIDAKSTEGQKKDSVKPKDEDKNKRTAEKTEFEETSPTKNEKSLDIAPSSSAASSEVKLKKEIGAWTNSLHGHQSKGY